MYATNARLMNPRRNINEVSRSLGKDMGTCLCGRIVESEDGKVKPHRPRTAYKEGVRLSRKARKGAWCEVPALLAKLGVNDAITLD